MTLLLFWGVLVSVQSASGQSQVTLRKELLWAASGQEILTPQLSPDGDFITLVTRGYVPDGVPDLFGLTDAASSASFIGSVSHPAGDRSSHPICVVGKPDMSSTGPAHGKSVNQGLKSAGLTFPS